MAHTFFEGQTARGAKVALTRFTGPLRDGDRRMVQLDVVDANGRHGSVWLTAEEVQTLHQQLSRFLVGDVSDASDQETF